MGGTDASPMPTLNKIFEFSGASRFIAEKTVQWLRLPFEVVAGICFAASAINPGDILNQGGRGGML